LSRREYAVVDEDDDEESIDGGGEYIHFPMLGKRVGTMFAVELSIAIVHEDEAEHIGEPVAENDEWEEEWWIEKRKDKSERIGHRHIGKDIIPWRER